MTDRQIASSLADTVALEKAARAQWQTADTIEERNAALDVVRHATVVIRSLEKWMAVRQLAANAR